MYFVVGAGAVGLTVAACLSTAVPVILVGKGQRRERVLVRLTGDLELEREIELVPISAIEDLAGTVLVCTKAYHLPGVLSQLTGRKEPIGLAQNGLGIITRAQSLLPAHSFFRVLMFFGALRIGASEVKLSARPKLRAWGGDAAAKSAAGELCNAFLAAGCKAELRESLDTLEFEKLSVNLITNTIATLLDAPNKVIFESLATEELALEVYACSGWESQYLLLQHRAWKSGWRWHHFQAGGY